MSIRVVTHAWAGKFSQYASFLKHHIDSLSRCYDACEKQVKLTLCYCPQDDLVVNVIDSMSSAEWLDRGWLLIPLHLPLLGRRSIGRNLAAKISKEDYVFFTDVDHVFEPICFESIPSRFEEGIAMIFPTEIKIHRLHSIGDAVANRALIDDPLPMNVLLKAENFTPKQYNRAIGGVQIVRGDIARLGYLDGTEWNVPSMPAFKDFLDDIAYRRACSERGRIQGVELSGIYRLRHSRTTYQDKVWTT